MVDRIPVPTPGALDLDAWGIPLTEAVNEHDTLIGRTLSGIELVSFASTNSHVRTVSFGITFPAPPQVFIGINSSAGATGQWHVRAYNITAVDFGLFAFSGDGGADVWSSVPCNWLALYNVP